jgi:hypothetical protein
MGIKWKKLKWGKKKKIPLLSTNQKTAFIYKVELYLKLGCENKITVKPTCTLKGTSTSQTLSIKGTSTSQILSIKGTSTSQKCHA